VMQRALRCDLPPVVVYSWSPLHTSVNFHRLSRCFQWVCACVYPFTVTMYPSN
jgi:hypothetical protein